MNCDIVSSKVTEFHIAYAKSNGNESKDHTVSEQLITRWNPNSKKFESKIYDKFLWSNRFALDSNNSIMLIYNLND